RSGSVRGATSARRTRDRRRPCASPGAAGGASRMEIIAVSDPDDPRVALYREIRDRDRIGRDGVFVAEGEVVLRVLLGPGSRFAPFSVLIAADRAARLLPTLPEAAGVPVFVAEPAVMDRIVGFPIHRGILAIGRIAAALSASAMLAAAPLPTVVVATLG